jgi:glyoxylase-like metal-dependent hydrolase (beta-lactamase superfamily II)
MQITDHVHVVRVKVRSYPEAYSPNVFLVVDGSDAVMVDSGFPDDGSVNTRLEYLRSLGSPNLKLIALTHHHFDHSSGAYRYQQETGVPVAMHPVEAGLLKQAARSVSPERTAEERKLRRQAARVKVDMQLDDGTAIPVGRLTLRALLMPGHSAGHMCFYLEDGKVLFSGDNVLGIGTTAIAPPPYGDMLQYLDSLRRMQSLDATIICPGHGPIVHQPRRKIQELIDHRRERDEQVLLLISQGKDRLSQIVWGIYPELDPRLERMANGQILSHLYKLQAEGRLTMKEEGEEISCELRG